MSTHSNLTENLHTPEISYCWVTSLRCMNQSYIFGKGRDVKSGCFHCSCFDHFTSHKHCSFHVELSLYSQFHFVWLVFNLIYRLQILILINNLDSNLAVNGLLWNNMLLTIITVYNKSFKLNYKISCHSPPKQPTAVPCWCLAGNATMFVKCVVNILLFTTKAVSKITPFSNTVLDIYLSIISIVYIYLSSRVWVGN